jgi:4-hydroxyphenylpyruvate dioxygenase
MQTTLVEKQHKGEWLNPVGLNGMEFVEYSSPNPDALEKVFLSLGFTRTGEHKKKNISLYQQGTGSDTVNFIINREANSFAQQFSKMHGPSICATGFKVSSVEKAFETAIKHGAKPVKDSNHSFKAVYGIGDSVIYFIDDQRKGEIYKNDFNVTKKSEFGCGLTRIDHLTNNVPVGEMQKWCDFYEKIFNFKEVRYFDIRGKSTGLVSKVMMSPCKQIIIPINEPTDGKSQIQEYLDEYKGSGIQHLAMSTNDIAATISSLRGLGVDFLGSPDTYYESIKTRVPQVTEDIDRLKNLRILVDGDHDGYLLQIFTKNMIGPIFFEIIQRKNHNGFGEGNFQALFDAIEEDQRKRGYLK